MPAHVELNIRVSNEAQKDILIALLSAAGASGFEEEKNALKAFIPEKEYNELLFDEIIQQNNSTYLKSVINERNWNAEWESGFKPVSIGAFCTIRAAFHPFDAGVKFDIIITPKMSFGTGHHATTHMMVAAMAKLDFTDKTVFDFGTGTGVLSVLAEKCGARSITAIDIDEWSIENAMENFNVNDCNKILLLKEEGLTENHKYDIILANINRNIIIEHLLSIQQHLAGNGVVLLSGLLTGDGPVIVAAALRHNLKLQQQSARDGWICLQMING